VSGGTTMVKTIFTCVWIEKKIFSRMSWPISIKFGRNYPWVKIIKNYSKEGPGSFPRGDNHKYAKIGWDHFETFSQEPLSHKSSYLLESFQI
jgi:hypothetical protein